MVSKHGVIRVEPRVENARMREKDRGAEDAWYSSRTDIRSD